MTTSAHIFLEDVVFHAYHGVLPQESRVGNCFIVNVRLKTDITSAAESDDLTTTIDYTGVYKVLKEEMDIPSKLLEHVCGRIVKRLFRDFPAIEEVELRLTKQNPPMGADIHACGVEVCCKRE
jgi:dihydroneopterin aldolase